MLNFSNTKDIYNLIELERISLTSALDIQKSFNKQVLVFIKKFMNTIDFSNIQNSNCKSFTYLSQATDILGKTTENINLINDLLTFLTQIDNSSKISKKLLENYNNNFKSNIDSIHKNTKKIEAFIHKNTVNNVSELLNSVVTEDSENTSFQEVKSSYFPENTLIISSTKGKVILPYKAKDIYNILNKSKKYTSYEDVINNLYTKPISYYKFSAIARFKEAYKLIREKENGSLVRAFSLAVELFGNYNLHPAIITACNSLDELDIYLACLDENSLSDFKFFDIKFDIPLTVSQIVQSTF